MNANAKILKRHTAFSPLSNAVLRKLTAHSSVEHFTKGQEVYREGTPCTAMFLMLSGRCQSMIRFQDESEHELNVYVPGDTFGEGALMSRDAYWTTIRVLTDSSLLRISRDDVAAALEKDLRLREHFYQMLQRNRHAIRNRPSLSSLGRVVSVMRLSPMLDTHPLVEALAKKLREDAHRSILILHFPVQVSDTVQPELLSRWAGGVSVQREGFHLKVPLKRMSPGIRILPMHNDVDDPRSALSHVISYASSFFRYVIISIPASTEPGLARACVVQSDHTFALLRPTEHSVARLEEWKTLVQADWLTPVVCREEQSPSVLEMPRLAGCQSLVLDPKDRRHGMGVTGMTRMISRSRIGLALSSGGAKSLAHVGVLQVLEEQGVEPDCVAGSSMGACVAALWASGMSAGDLKDVALKLERRFSMLRMIDPVFPPRRGFMKGRAIYRWLEDALGGLHFEDLPRKLYIIVTDMETLERVVVTSGPVLPAIHASMAMPGVIVPPRFRGRYSFDGSIADPLPVGVLQDDGVEHVIAVNTIPNPEDLKACSFDPSEQRPSRWSPFRWLRSQVDFFAEGNLVDLFMRSMHGVQTQVAEASCARADVTIRPVSCDGSWHNFSQPRKYIEIGRQAALAQVDALRQMEESR